MRSYIFRSTCAVILWVSVLGIGRASPPDTAVWPLGRYTVVSKQLLPDALQRLFYAGSKQVKGYSISVVQAGGFPAVNRQGQSIILNSVLVAAMDAAIEADYLASSARDGDDALSRYLALLYDSAAKFAGTDWQEWVNKLPRFAEFYQVRGGPLETVVPYELVRQTILTSAIGSVLARELTRIDTPPAERLNPGVADELNRQSASVVGRAGFDAAPGTALVIYEALMDVQEKKVRPLDVIECSEARYQRFLQMSGSRGNPREQSGSFVITFTAGQRLFDRLSNCT